MIFCTHVNQLKNIVQAFAFPSRCKEGNEDSSTGSGKCTGEDVYSDSK
jgi:hypothetical protein